MVDGLLNTLCDTDVKEKEMYAEWDQSWVNTPEIISTCCKRELEAMLRILSARLNDVYTRRKAQRGFTEDGTNYKTLKQENDTRHVLQVDFYLYSLKLKGYDILIGYCKEHLFVVGSAVVAYNIFIQH